MNGNKHLYLISLLGIGDWGLGIGDWGLGAIANPQTPIPNPPDTNKIYNFLIYYKLIRFISEIYINI